MRSLALAATLLAGVLGAAAAAPEPFTPDDVYRVVSLSAPRIAPDGARVLVVARTADRENDRWMRRLDVVDVASGKRHTLPLPAKFSSPCWSPSGDRIAYISGGGVWIAGPEGESPRRVTDAAHDVVQFAWRPDGNALAFVALDPAPQKSGDARYLDAYEVGNDAALADGARRLAHLWVQPLDGGAARALGPRNGSVTSGDAESTLSWSPDGSAIAYLHAPTNLANDAVAARVRLVDVARGTDRRCPDRRTKSTTRCSRRTARSSPTRTATATTSCIRSSCSSRRRSGGAARNVSHAVDRAVRDVAWQPGSSTLWFTVTSGDAARAVPERRFRDAAPGRCRRAQHFVRGSTARSIGTAASRSSRRRRSVPTNCICLAGRQR